MFPDLKTTTKPELLEALSASANREMSADEVRAQRVSFILGSMQEGSGVTRAQVDAVLARHNGRP